MHELVIIENGHIDARFKHETATKTSDITATKNLHISPSAVVTEPLVEARNTI